MNYRTDQCRSPGFLADVNQYTNRMGLHPIQVLNCIHDTYYEEDVGDMSGHTLATPPQLVQLLNRHQSELHEDVSEMLWKFLGKMIHGGLAATLPQGKDSEEHEIAYPRVEQRRYASVRPDVPGTVSTKADVIAPIVNPAAPHPETFSREEYRDWYLNNAQGGIHGWDVINYKTTVAWSVGQDDVIEQWRQDMEGEVYVLEQAGYKIKRAWIFAIIRDWQGFKVNDKKEYPPVPFFPIALRIGTTEQIAETAKRRWEGHWRARTLPDAELPPCNQFQRWKKDRRCQSYCPVSAHCHQFRTQIEPTLKGK